MSPIRLPDNPAVLIVALRRLGDVLLTTPLIRSLKQAFPGGTIDAVVFAGTEGILAGNPDLARVFPLRPHWHWVETFALLLRLSRHYDLALSTQTGDRPTAVAWIAGRQSMGPLAADGLSAAVKRRALTHSYTSNPEGDAQHRVLDVLRPAAMLGIPALTDVVCPAGEVRPDVIPARPYAVIHAAPMFKYKRWRTDAWRMLAAALRSRGLATVVTGGPADREYLDEVWRDRDVTRLDGRLSWPEVAAVIGAAQVYVGPDTAVTHLAAATGTQTVALYGPTDPRVWGPWPVGGLDLPWAARGTLQNRNNVWLVQNPLPCLPCQQEGCERRLDSRSQCLDELSVVQVLSAVDQALAVRRAA